MVGAARSSVASAVAVAVSVVFSASVAMVLSSSASAGLVDLYSVTAVGYAGAETTLTSLSSPIS